jgi:hypothetical protein
LADFTYRTLAQRDLSINSEQDVLQRIRKYIQSFDEFDEFWHKLVALVPLSKTRMQIRKDKLTSQRVEVALVFQEMLGTAAALEYLALNNVAVSIAMRVLSECETRRRVESSFIGQSAPERF